MKIAIDIRHLTAKHPSGVGRYTIELIHALAKTSKEDVFYLFASGSARSLDQLPDFPYKNVHIFRKHIPNKILSLILKANIRPLESFLDDKPDVWLFPNVNSIYTHLPYALTVHDISPFLYPEFFTRKDHAWNRFICFKRCVQNASHLITVSQTTKQDLIEEFRIDSDTISTTPLGVTNVYTKKIEPSDRSFLQSHTISFPYFLTLSTKEPRKNIESIIEAYSTWRKKHANPRGWHQDSTCANQTNTTQESSKHPRQPRGLARIPHLVIAGGEGWKSESVQRLAAESSFKQDIHFLGYVPEKHKPALYRNAEAFFFPSFYEGFGLPPKEAAACGTPVVTSFSSSLPEVMQQTAVYVDPYNVTDIVQAIEVVNSKSIKLPSLASEPSETWRETAKKTLKILYLIRG